MQTKRPYYLYAVPSADWTIEMEQMHDFVKAYNGFIYYISRTADEAADEINDAPKELQSWLCVCESVLVEDAYKKKAERAVRKLERDMRNNLEKMLQEEAANE